MDGHETGVPSSGRGEKWGRGEEEWVGVLVLTSPCGRQQRAAARCAGRCPCSAAHGKLRAQPGWHSRGSCPSTGAASRLQGTREGQRRHRLSSQASPFSAGLARGRPGPGVWVQGRRSRTRGPPGVQSPGPEWDWTQRKQLTHNHDIVPAVVVAEREVAACGSVASDHQGHVQDASLQDCHRPHSQEAHH